MEIRNNKENGSLEVFDNSGENLGPILTMEALMAMEARAEIQPINETVRKNDRATPAED